MASLLAHDYASLAKEAGRRHSDVRDAADKAHQLIKAGKDDVFNDLRADPPPAQHPLYQPIFLASATRNAKVIALAVSALQRLILSAAVPRAFVAQILDTLEQVIPQGVDIQLKVLQTLVSLLTTSAPVPGTPPGPGGRTEKLVQGEELGRALELSHRLSTSKIPVVASTASATLRQLFMFVFERVGEEDALVASSPDAGSDPTLPRATFDVDVPPLEEDRAAALGATLTLRPRFIEGDSPASPEPAPPRVLAEPDASANQAKSIRLRPAARDAYLLLEDLCLLIAGSVEGGPDGEPSFLRWGSLSRTFGLELVESIVSGFGDIVRAHPELLLVLRAHLCPLLIRFLSSPPHSTLSSSTSFAFSFPLTLRLTRVVFLLLKQFSDLLTLESEVFLTMFVRVIAPGDRGEGEGGHPTGAAGQHSPLWMRVLALEIFRGLCADFPLMVKFFRRYDAAAAEERARAGKGKGKAAGGGSTVFSDMLTAFNRLATEKPAALGVGAAVMYGSSLGPVFSHAPAHVAGAASPSASGAGGVIDSAMEMGWGVAAGVGSVVGSSVAAAAGAVSSASASAAPAPSLSTATAAMKLQCIDQLDKAEPPHIPEGYLFLLALQCLAALADGFGAFTLAAAADVSARYGLARPAVDWAALEAREDARADPQVASLKVVRAMAESTWPAFLASLSFFIATALSDDLFADVVASLQSFTTVLGVLDLETPREAFLTSLCKFAMPPQVVSHLATAQDHPSSLSHHHAGKPSSAAAAVLSAGAESLALLAGSPSAGAALPVGLSARNLACLRALIAVAHFLAPALGWSWFCVFETLQNADFVLRTTGAARGAKKRSAPPPAAAAPAPAAPAVAEQGETPPLPVLPSEADEAAAQHAIGELFDVGRTLDDAPFRRFVGALCRLSGEMIGLAMREDGTVAAAEERSEDGGGTTTPTAAAPLDTPSRRRSSGISVGGRAGAAHARAESSFGIAKLGAVALGNIARLIARPPDVGWDLVTGHLLHVLHCVGAPTPVRIQAADVLGQLLTLAPKSLESLPAPAAREEEVEDDAHARAERVQMQVLSALAVQAEPAPRLQSSTDVDIRRRALETLLRILESNGHAFVTGWATIFHVLRTACPASSSGGGVWAAPPSPVPSSSARRSLDTISEYDGLGPGALMTPVRGSGGGGGDGGYFSARDAGRGAKTAVLVRTSFPSLQLICTDFLDPLSGDEIRDCIGTLAEFGKQGEDVNVALTAGGLLWNVSDHVQAKRRAGDAETAQGDLWMYLLQNLLALCRDARQEVRDAAITNVFRSISMYGATLDGATWNAVCWEVVFPLVEDISASIEQHNARGPDDDDALGEETVPQANGPPIRLVDKQWDDSKQLALRSVGDVFFEYLAQLVKTDRYEDIWRAFVGLVQRSFVGDRPQPATAAMQALEKVLTVSLDMADADRIASSWDVAWTAWDEIGTAIEENALAKEADATEKVFTQVNLEAFVRVVLPIYTPPYISFDLARVQRLLSVLKTVLTYTKSPDYRSDVDGLMPLQSAILEVIAVIKLDDIPGATSAVLSDLAEYLMLAFTAPFAKSPPSGLARATAAQQVTYISLAKEIMPHVQWLYRKYADDPLVYEQGAVGKMLQAYALPLRLKHDCPPPAKFGSAEPLWKTATVNFLKAVRDVTTGLQQLDEQLSPKTHQAIWAQVVEGFEGALLAADSTVNRSLDDLHQEENFDLALLISLERDVLPHLGSSRVPDVLIRRLGKTLQLASRLYELDLPSSSSAHSHARANGSMLDTPPPTPPEPRFDPDFDKQVLGDMYGTTVEVVETGRERLAYWCLDLLFHVCGAAEQAPPSRQRIAALIVPSLLNRCTAVFRTYVADAPLRGKMPFPRIRQEELVYLLQQLLSLRLFPNSLWASSQPSPSEAIASPSALDASLPLTTLVRSALLRSPLAHLYELHPRFTGLLQLSNLAPSITAAYVPHRRLVGLDAETGEASYEGLPAGFEPGVVGRARRTDEKVETDVVKLVLACLAAVGQEIGARGS
ncbi:Endocytosis and vacuole integrity protein [Rhodotorula kratochvilovae]